MDLADLSIEDLKTFLHSAEANAEKLGVSTTVAGSSRLGWLNMASFGEEELRQIREEALAEGLLKNVEG